MDRRAPVLESRFLGLLLFHPLRVKSGARPFPETWASTQAVLHRVTGRVLSWRCPRPSTGAQGHRRGAPPLAARPSFPARGANLRGGRLCARVCAGVSPRGPAGGTGRVGRAERSRSAAAIPAHLRAGRRPAPTQSPATLSSPPSSVAGPPPTAASRRIAGRTGKTAPHSGSNFPPGSGLWERTGGASVRARRGDGLARNRSPGARCVPRVPTRVLSVCPRAAAGRRRRAPAEHEARPGPGRLRVERVN